MPTDKKRIKRR